MPVEAEKVWMQTATGKQFYPLAPKMTDIDIEDIAHALSLQCRFNGHTRKFYSVAEHSVHVSYAVPRKMALPALLHDAHEAYLGDMISPLKAHFPKMSKYEEVLDRLIQGRFNYSVTMEEAAIIKQADMYLCKLEAENLLSRPELVKLWNFPDDLTAPVEYFPRFHCVSPDDAGGVFLARFNQLMEKKDAA